MGFLLGNRHRGGSSPLGGDRTAASPWSDRAAVLQNADLTPRLVVDRPGRRNGIELTFLISQARAERLARAGRTDTIDVGGAGCPSSMSAVAGPEG